MNNNIVFFVKVYLGLTHLFVMYVNISLNISRTIL